MTQSQDEEEGKEDDVDEDVAFEDLPEADRPLRPAKAAKRSGRYNQWTRQEDFTLFSEILNYLNISLTYFCNYYSTSLYSKYLHFSP
jgi:hypothetical protein